MKHQAIKDHSRIHCFLAMNALSHCSFFNLSVQLRVTSPYSSDILFAPSFCAVALHFFEAFSLFFSSSSSVLIVMLFSVKNSPSNACSKYNIKMVILRPNVHLVSCSVSLTSRALGLSFLEHLSCRQVSTGHTGMQGSARNARECTKW